MIASPCTLIYDACIQSWGGVLNESIALISIIVSICLFVVSLFRIEFSKKADDDRIYAAEKETYKKAA